MIFESNGPTVIEINNSFSIKKKSDSNSKIRIEGGRLFSNNVEDLDIKISSQEKDLVLKNGVAENRFLEIKCNPKTLFATGISNISLSQLSSSASDENSISFLVKSYNDKEASLLNSNIQFFREDGLPRPFATFIGKNGDDGFMLKIRNGSISGAFLIEDDDEEDTFKKVYNFSVGEKSGQKILGMKISENGDNISISPELREEAGGDFRSVAIIDFDAVSVVDIFQ